MNQRILLFVGFLICTTLVIAALYFQYTTDLEPCPLCIFQRLAFISLGIIFLAWAGQDPNKWGRYIYGVLSVIVGSFGIKIAARHVWLQNLPESQVPECGPGLEFMLQTSPLKEVIARALRGSGECAEIKWTLFSISMPGWSLIWLILLTLLALWVLINPSNK